MLDPGRSARGANRGNASVLAFGRLSDASGSGESQRTERDGRRVAREVVAANNRKSGMATGTRGKACRGNWSTPGDRRRTIFCAVYGSDHESWDDLRHT